MATKILTIIICLLLIGFPQAVRGEGDMYHVCDKDGLDETFDSYDAAYSFYVSHLDEHDDLLLKRQDKVIHMEYGIVEFPVSEACDVVVDYHSLDSGRDLQINGCYGADALYLYTDKNGEYVYFLQAGDRGRAAIEDVVLHPYEELDRISSYTMREGKLYHDIRNQFLSDHFAYSLALAERPSFLQEGKTYFSYDGHYFYEDILKMSDDVRNETHDGSVNKEAYYNYFQYLPHRSYTAYSAGELEQYIEDILGISGRLKHYDDLDRDGAADEVNRSQLFSQADHLIASQGIYGANALLLLAEAINESSYGKSLSCFVNNNLYLASAYDSDIERENDRYGSVAESILSRARYIISSHYSNMHRNDYVGTFLGDRKSGINSTYSNDPYYGERCAAACFEIDMLLGGKDIGREAIGIINGRNSLRLYEDEAMSSVLLDLNGFSELSFIILEEVREGYKVRIDLPFSADYSYDPSGSIAYVAKDAFDLVINGDRIHEDELTAVDYDLAGGGYDGFTKVRAFFRNGEDIACIKPILTGQEFTGYDDNQKAQYRPIESISLTGGTDQLEAGRPIRLDGCYLQIDYGDEKRNIELDTDMISGYDPSKEGRQTVNVSYAGMETSYEITLSDELSSLRSKIDLALASGDPQAVKQLLGKIRYPFTFRQIRDLDIYLKEKNVRNYVIVDDTQRHDLSISGLDLSLDDKKSFNFFGDTYYVYVKDIPAGDRDRIMEVADGYGFSAEKGIDIRFGFNYQDIHLKGPAIVQVVLADKKPNHIYSVYHLDEQGDIIKCRTTQSESCVQFLIYEEGSYLIMSMPGVNEYDIKDETEDLSYENMGTDNHKRNFSLMAILVLALEGLAGITLYYIYYHKRSRMWKDFRRSLRKAATVQEEKPNS